MYERYDEIELENGRKYIVVNTINLDSNLYLYVINENINEEDIALIKVIHENGQGSFKNIENEEEYNKVFAMLTEQNKQALEELLKENE